MFILGSFVNLGRLAICLAIAIWFATSTPALAKRQSQAKLPEAESEVFVKALDARPLARLFTRKSLPDEVTGECRDNAAGTRASDSTAMLGAGCTRCLGVVPIFEESIPQLNLDIAFAKISDKIPAQESAILDKLAIALLSSPLLESKIAVAGHTDSSGKAALNLKLSCARSLAVRAYLTQKGVASHRMTAYGFGSKRPIEGTPASAEQNRRVEIRMVP